MKYITEALLFLTLLCLTSQGVESRPSGATEDVGSEERLKRDAQGVLFHEANFHEGKHNFGSQVNTHYGSQTTNRNIEYELELELDGSPEHETSTNEHRLNVDNSLQPKNIRYKKVEICDAYPASPENLRNRRSPFDYTGSTQNYHNNYNGGTHNFGYQSHYQIQPTASKKGVEPHQDTTSQIKTTEGQTLPKVFHWKKCHWEKVSIPEQGSIDKTPERQKRAPFDYRGSQNNYAGDHVQAEEGSSPNWKNRNDYAGNHIQNENNEYQVQGPNYGPSPYQPYRQPAHLQLKVQRSNYGPFPFQQSATQQFNQYGY